MYSESPASAQLDVITDRSGGALASRHVGSLHRLLGNAGRLQNAGILSAVQAVMGRVTGDETVVGPNLSI